MEHHPSTCLNCNTALISDYCHKCGQKADTHRITLKHFIQHDLVHGIWHFDKGLLFTLKESFLRPGYMAVEYVRGKRVRYYNIFYLALLVLGINVLVSHYFREYYHQAETVTPKGIVIEKDTVDLSYYVRHYFKLILFLFIPFFALSGMKNFKKLGMNFAEHAIIGGNILLTGAIWSFLLIIFSYSTRNIASGIVSFIGYTLLAIIALVPVQVYYQATRKLYTLGGFIGRMLLWYLWLSFQLFLVLLLIAAITGKGNINLI